MSKVKWTSDIHNPFDERDQLQRLTEGQTKLLLKGALSRAALGTRFCLFGGEIYVLSSFFIVLDLVNPWPSDLETSTDAFLLTWAS